MLTRHLLPLLLSATTLLLAACQSYTPTESIGSGEPEQPPATVEFLNRKQSGMDYKYRDYYLKLALKNRHDQAMWFVIRYIGNEPLAADGMFKGKKVKARQPFSSWLYDGSRTGGQGVAVKVEHLGQEKFSAFRLPPGGSLVFDRFHIMSPLNFHTFEVWEAPMILVNAKTPLEDWLPYRTLCDPVVKLTKDAEGTNLDWDAERMGNRKDYPNEPVSLVWVEAKRKWKLKMRY